MEPEPKLIDVVIPVLNEEASLPKVLRALPWERLRYVVVVDNGSVDASATVARKNGARVVSEPQRGYGAACLRALAELASSPPDIVVFLDGDDSDDASQLLQITAPIEADNADFVVGSRVLGNAEKGALTLPQRVGNVIACAGIRHFYGGQFTDLGPFRAIRWSKLAEMKMRDRNFGWTVEMQIKASKMKLRCVEVPVRYRCRRLGQSKVSGSLWGSVQAGVIILRTLASHLEGGEYVPSSLRSVLPRTRARRTRVNE